MVKRKKIVPPTSAEIDAEVAVLKELLPHVRRSTAFGDDNHAAIEIQIHILKERMDSGEVFDRYEKRGPEDEDNTEHGLDHALDAHRWMTGEGDGEKPSDGWKSLDTRKRK